MRLYKRLKAILLGCLEKSKGNNDLLNSQIFKTLLNHEDFWRVQLRLLEHLEREENGGDQSDAGLLDDY